MTPHDHRFSLPSEVTPHDMKTCALCQAPAYATSNTECNQATIHHTLETLVANGVLRKVRDEHGEITYIEYAKGICAKCGATFEIAHPEISSTFCESCGYLQHTDDARARFRQSFTILISDQWIGKR